MLRSVCAVVSMLPASILVISAAILQSSNSGAWGWFFGFGIFFFLLGFHYLEQAMTFTPADDPAEAANIAMEFMDEN